jgi:hypothetical protein
MIGRVIGRLIVVPVGFVLALIAAGTVLVTLGLERVTHSLHRNPVDGEQMLGVALYAFDIAAAASIIPAIVVVIVGEVARIRSALYYIVGGGLALLALPLLARSGSLDRSWAQFGPIWQVCATAGFVGGLVYWLVAGRRA